MKLTAINASAREQGNTETLIKEVFAPCIEEGIETKIISLCDKRIEPCQGCFACSGQRCCVAIKDDFNEVFSEIVSSEGILLASPVYSADVSAKMKAFLERGGVVVATNPKMLAHKVGACVAALRRGGGMSTVDTMNHFLLNKEVFVVGSTYWNMVYGKDPEDVKNDLEGMKNMRNLGENMAYLMKILFESVKK